MHAVVLSFLEIVICVKISVFTAIQALSIATQIIALIVTQSLPLFLCRYPIVTRFEQNHGFPKSDQNRHLWLSLQNDHQAQTWIWTLPSEPPLNWPKSRNPS